MAIFGKLIIAERIKSRTFAAMNKRIAIIEPVYLTASGLKVLLDSLMPFAETVIFDNFETFQKECSRQGSEWHFVHFFVSSKILFEHANFFAQQPQITIVLLYGNSISDALLHSKFKFIDITQNEPLLVKSLLALHGNGHPAQQHHIDTAIQKDVPLLSEREVDVLKLVAQGFLNKEIADKLHIAITTVVSHRQHITEKLKLKSVAALTIYAVVNGYVDYSSVYIPTDTEI